MKSSIALGFGRAVPETGQGAIGQHDPAGRALIVLLEAIDDGMEKMAASQIREVLKADLRERPQNEFYLAAVWVAAIQRRATILAELAAMLRTTRAQAACSARVGGCAGLGAEGWLYEPRAPALGSAQTRRHRLLCLTRPQMVSDSREDDA